MAWYHYMSIIMLLLMVVSPAWFFGKVGKILFEEHEPHDPVVQHINPKSVLPFHEDETVIHQDEKILHNLNMMVKKSKKKHVKQLWKIKKLEFERQLRWKASIRKAYDA